MIQLPRISLYLLRPESLRRRLCPEGGSLAPIAETSQLARHNTSHNNDDNARQMG